MSKGYNNLKYLFFRKGLIVKWPLGENSASWKDVTIEGSIVCNDMTPKGEPVEFSVVKKAAAGDISMKSTAADVEISVEKVLEMFRLSTQNFSGGEPNKLGFEAVDITTSHLEMVIIPNEALEFGVRGKITSDNAGQFGKEQDTLLMAQHITDNAFPAVALLHESPPSGIAFLHFLKTIHVSFCYAYKFKLPFNIHDTVSGLPNSRWSWSLWWI